MGFDNIIINRYLVYMTHYRYKFILQCWEVDPVNRPRFTSIVDALSDSLQAMAGYLDISAFGETIAERNKCRETLESVEEQSLCQALNAKEEEHQGDHEAS